jgi:hypothetical protein
VMKRYAWTGWLVAGLLLLQNATVALGAPTASNPLEGRLLQHTTGTFYVYHAGLKFAVQVAELGETVIDAIPVATADEWDALFGAAPTLRPLPLPRTPEPFPGYS